MIEKVTGVSNVVYFIGFHVYFDCVWCIVIYSEKFDLTFVLRLLYL
jgi:hypothetical protein